MIGNSKNQKKPRQIRFESLDEILRDAERISRANQVDQLGNWTPGQAFEHLAKSFDSSVRESEAVLPIWRRAIARILKPFMLHFGLPAGIRIESISEVAAREFLPGEGIAMERGLRELQRAIAQLSAQEMSAKHNCFGSMSPRDWERMHCRHAELHLRLLIPLDGQEAG